MKTTFWHVVLRTAAGYTWTGYFMFEPMPQDICDILELEMEEKCDPRARALFALSEHIPYEYVEEAKEHECPIRVAGTEIGTIGIRKKEAHTQ